MNNLFQSTRQYVGLAGTLLGSLLIGLPIADVAAQTTNAINPCPRIYYEEPYNSTLVIPEDCPANAFSQLVRTQGASSSQAAQPRTPLTPNAIAPTDALTTPTQVLPSPNLSSNATVSARTADSDYSPTLRAQTNSPVQPPLPEEQTEAVASVMPMNGTVDVMLSNNTNAIVTYEVIGHTQRRTLAGGEEVVLQNLPVPVTITTVRQDGGLVDVMAMNQAAMSSSSNATGSTANSMSGAMANSMSDMLHLSLNESQNLDDKAGAVRIQADGQVFIN